MFGNNGYSAYGTYAYPNYSNNFSQQYNNNGQPQTPYNNSPIVQQPQQSMQPQSNGNYFYVNGIEGAKAFLVPANSTAVLFDSDSNKLYIKSANNQGQATLKAFEYSEIQPQQAPQQAKAPDMSNYITREEFEQFKANMKPKVEPVKVEVKKNV